MLRNLIFCNNVVKNRKQKQENYDVNVLTAIVADAVMELIIV